MFEHQPVLPRLGVRRNPPSVRPVTGMPKRVAETSSLRYYRSRHIPYSPSRFLWVCAARGHKALEFSGGGYYLSFPRIALAQDEP